MELMELMELMNLIRNSVNVTEYNSKEIYIEKPKETGWYHPDPSDIVFNILTENGIEFEIKNSAYEDVFKLDSGLFIVIYEEED